MKRKPTLWEVQELFRDEKWMEEAIDGAIKDAIKDATFYPVGSKKGLKMRASFPVYNDVTSIDSKASFSDFEESLFYLCDKKCGEFDLDCAKRWHSRLKKLVVDFGEEIKKAEQ